MTNSDDIKAAVYKAGYEKCHVITNGESVTVYASPAKPGKDGVFKLGGILRDLKVSLTDHTIWIDTEICTGRLA